MLRPGLQFFPTMMCIAKIQTRWMRRAQQFEIDHDAAQSPSLPFPITAPAPPSGGFNAAISGATHVVGVTIA